MAFTLEPLLMHSDAVPEQAKNALKAASLVPPIERKAQLESAARILYRETDLDCVDARELVGLSWLRDCG